jgi:small subunit ribosomal protein S8
MWSDPIADFLTRLRNAARNGMKTVVVPFNTVKLDVCKVLLEEGYIVGFDKVEDAHQGQIRVEMKYGPHGESVIQSIKRFSKVGCRVYRGWKDIPTILNGMGICIVSTSRGVMSDRRCRLDKVGGEVICSVY